MTRKIRVTYGLPCVSNIAESLNDDVIILIMRLMLKSLLKSKDVLYQVSSDFGEINSFYSSFSDAEQKRPPAFQKFKKDGDFGSIIIRSEKK